MTLHIYSPPRFATRRIAHCRSCKRLARHIVTMYLWRESDWVCGRCGYDYTGRTGKRARQRNIERVRQLWPQLRHHREVMQELIAAVTAESEFIQEHP